MFLLQVNYHFLGPLGPIANANLQGNFQPFKQFGFGGYGGLENYGAQVNLFLTTRRLVKWDKGRSQEFVQSPFSL